MTKSIERPYSTMKGRRECDKYSSATKRGGARCTKAAGRCKRFVELKRTQLWGKRDQESVGSRRTKQYEVDITDLANFQNKRQNQVINRSLGQALCLE